MKTHLHTEIYRYLELVPGIGCFVLESRDCFCNSPANHAALSRAKALIELLNFDPVEHWCF